MKYNRKLGKSIMRRYLTGFHDNLKLKHSEDVGEFAFKVAKKIKTRHQELVLDPEFVGFLGYVHDIGYSVEVLKHELRTIDTLIHSEKIPTKIARVVMHGQLAEQFGEKEGNVKKYLPIGLEGIILTYADMSIRTGKPMSIRKRANGVIKRMKKCSRLQNSQKEDMIDSMYKALPRFKRYEKLVLKLADVKSSKEF